VGLEEIFDNTLMGPYTPPPASFSKFGSSGDKEAGDSIRAQSLRRTSYYPYTLVQQQFSRSYTLKLYDSSNGYPKLAGITTGLTKIEADRQFLLIKNLMRKEEF
jgi:hypothetical protein